MDPTRRNPELNAPETTEPSTKDQLSRPQERARCNHRYTDIPPRLSLSLPQIAKLSKISPKKRRNRPARSLSVCGRNTSVPWGATSRTMPLPNKGYTSMVTLRALTAWARIMPAQKGSTFKVHGRHVTRHEANIISPLTSLPPNHRLGGRTPLAGTSTR